MNPIYLLVLEVLKCVKMDPIWLLVFAGIVFELGFLFCLETLRRV
jgi:hypothetical protein